MLDGKRKSIEPMAARLADGDEQCLQQFVNQSPWDPVPVRRALARRMSRELEPEAWVIDDTGFPKFGKRSVGVARQYSGALGKVGNCQIGVSINAAGRERVVPAGLAAVSPEGVGRGGRVQPERRQQARLPEDVHHVEKWRLALEMIDELIGWGLTPPVILGDGAYGDTTELRAGLEQRGLDYVLDVKGTTSAYREEVSPSSRRQRRAVGGRRAARYREDPSSLKQLALTPGKKAAVSGHLARGDAREDELAVPRAQGPPGEHRPAQPSAQGRRGAGGPLADLRVARQRVRADQVLALEPAADTPLKQLVRLAKLRWRIEQDYRELKDALGLDHFEGRSYPGWNHHVTLVSIAHAFLTLERRPLPSSQGGSLTLFGVVRELQALLACWHGHLPHLPQRAAARPPTPSPTDLTEHY